MFYLNFRKRKKTRVGVDGGDYLIGSPVKNGIQRLVASVWEHYLHNHEDTMEVFYYYFGKNEIAHKDGKALLSIKLPKKLFSSLFLPIRMYWDKARIYVGFSGVLPPFTRIFGIKSVICIHDFAFIKYPQYFADPAKMKWQTEYAIYGADRVIVFSDYIKNELISMYPKISKDKVIRIYPGSDHLRQRQSGHQISQPYFLYVGVIKPMKNIEKLLSYFESYIQVSKDSRTKLVLVGTAEPDYMAHLQETGPFQSMKNRLIFKTKINDSDLVGYCRNAKALLNTSYDEGFCYPVAEALRIGTPVIVNDLPLYYEYKKYYPMITIAKDEAQFISAMSHVQKSSKPEGDVPFKWSTFKDDMLQVITRLI